MSMCTFFYCCKFTTLKKVDMKHLEVLIITENNTRPKILNWKVSIVNNIETAIEKLQQQSYKVIVISNSFNKMDKKKLRQITTFYNDVILVDYNDNKNLAEIVKRAYWLRNKPDNKSNYLDNSFEIKLANSLNLNQ